MFQFFFSSAMSDVTQFLGRLVPNTQCNYKLDNCSQRKCVVRSPHYPGLYPRNLTCSYHIFVLPGEVPSGKQAKCITKYSLNKMEGSTLLGLIFILSIFTLIFQLWSSLASCSVLDNSLLLKNSQKRNFASYFFSFDVYFCWIVSSFV